MCKLGNVRSVLVKIPIDLSCTGFAKMQYELIDECIASLVHALQQGCIDMRGSCCGHGNSEGDIHLQDGRVLIILDKELGDIYLSEKNKDKNIASILRGWEEKG